MTHDLSLKGVYPYRPVYKPVDKGFNHRPLVGDLTGRSLVHPWLQGFLREKVF